jgi:hypothetical protein
VYSTSLRKDEKQISLRKLQAAQQSVQATRLRLLNSWVAGAIRRAPNANRYPGLAVVGTFAGSSTPSEEDVTIVFARDDDYFFGVLHSKPHELWALRMGTSLEDRPRYTPPTTFETFPRGDKAPSLLPDASIIKSGA